MNPGLPPNTILAWSALEDPYPDYHRLQDHEPVHWSEVLGAWVITRYEDVANAFKDPRFSSQRLFLITQAQLRGLDPALVADYVNVFEHTLLMKDAPDHTRLRKAANYGFTPSAVTSWTPTIQAVVDRLLDGALLGSSFDLVADFADPLPTTIIAQLFGIEGSEQAKFSQWANAMARFFGGFGGEDLQTAATHANTGARELTALFRHHAELRRANPGTDLLSHMVRGQAEGKQSDDELAAQCVFILAAGLATVTDQLSNALNALLRHPDAFASLHGSTAGQLDAVIAECVRWDGAVPFMHRVMGEPVELHGKTLEPGQVVFLGIGAANHDPRQFDRPDAFDVRRTGTRPLSFGAGPHYCLGASLGQLEIAIAIASLLAKRPTLRLDDARPAQRKSSLLFRGFASLPAHA